MRQAGIQVLYQRRRRGCTVRDPDAQLSSDLLNRNFIVEAPNRLWVTGLVTHSNIFRATSDSGRSASLRRFRVSRRSGSVGFARNCGARYEPATSGLVAS
jgi:hypothetical protein